ncbi:MAG: hypothetical protein HY082_07265 [Gammaproteobacteria bacterium]|nr:hypothetical protein [Gammaproteobacteria bacterium]
MAQWKGTAGYWLILNWPPILPYFTGFSSHLFCFPRKIHDQGASPDLMEQGFAWLGI